MAKEVQDDGNKSGDGNAKSPPPQNIGKTPSSPDKLGAGRSPDSKVRYSFEDELTFSPRLNSLSMKMVSGVNRPSIIERKQEKKTEDTIMFAFKPNLSNNSTKIVAKMKTCFWERQNKVVQRRLEMVEQGPSTIHPNLRQSSSKENSEEGKKKNGILASSSEQTCTLNSTCKKNRSKSRSPYQKSVDLLLALKKGGDVSPQMEGSEKCSCGEIKGDGNKKLTRRRNLEHITKQMINNRNSISKNDINASSSRQVKKEQFKDNKLPSTSLNAKVQRITSATKILLDNQTLSDDNSSSRNKSKALELPKKQQLLEKRKSLEKLINGSDKRPNVTVDKGGSKLTSKDGRKHDRTFTFPVGKDRTDEMDAIHQNMVKMKKVAGQAVKKKKVFVCNGPYSSLRVALRRRGWIEKHFKVGDPPLLKQEGSTSKPSDEEDVDGDAKSTMGEKDNTDLESDSSSFLCDNQYGIMSRIVRKSMPILLWTLRRDDIDFRFLHKDQIVNHFLSANSFTTKAGLSTTLNNLRHFDDWNASLFFPRCYRLCCEEEKEEFVEDYQLTALQGILKVVIEKHKEWETHLNNEKENNHPPENETEVKPSTAKEKSRVVLNSDVFRLVLKTCYDYLESKQHVDIEETFCPIEDVQKRANWMRILDYFKKLALQDGVIIGASEYVNECKRILNKMEVYHPQIKIDGYQNVWILKPGAKSRGRGIEVMNMLSDILSLSSDTISKKENRWVIQKYIEKPYLIYRTKFDIRQWFLVTDWNPLMLWFYKDSYIRFCSQEFQLDKFDPQVHLSNNSVQKHFKNGERSGNLPESNMWSSDEFKKFLKSRDQESYWDDVIYPGMKKAITAVLISSHESLEYRKNSFELYGADFMIGEDLQPWLIEINASPALGPSTAVTERLCRNVLEDTLKVILDRRDNKECDTGQFELAFKRPYIPLPPYVGCTISVDGLPLKPVTLSKKKSNVPKVIPKTPIPPKESDNSISAESTVSCPQSDHSLKAAAKKTKSNTEASRSENNPSTHLPIVKYSKKEDNTVKDEHKCVASVSTKKTKTLLTAKRAKAGKVVKSRSNHDAEILKALIEPRVCAFPLDTNANVEAFKELRNSYPCYRFSNPVESKDISDDEDDNVNTLELFQPYKMRYRTVNNINNTSLSRQFSLLTSEDVNRLKRRRWNAVES